MAKALKLESPAPWKVFIVEDHPVFREGLAQTLNAEPDLSVCGKACSAEQALEAIPRFKPDVVLVDLTLPGKSGLQMIKEIRNTDRNIKLLVVSMHDESLYANRVLRAGGDGYVMKQEDPEEIVRAIRDVLNGYLYVSEEVVRGIGSGGVPTAGDGQDEEDRLAELTDGELEILELLGRGNTNQEIARKLPLDARRVTTLCGQIKKKLKLKTTNALIRHAVCWVEENSG